MNISRKILWGGPLAALALACAAAIPWDTSGSRRDPLPPLRPAKRRAPDPVKPPRLSESEAEHLLGSILARIREEYVRKLSLPGGCGTRGPWLSEDRHGNGPKARLFARAYPGVAKRIILEIFEDAEAPATDRGFALLMLNSLNDWTTDRLEELLRFQVETADEYSNYFPLRALGWRDRTWRHRDLYHRECRRGNQAAFEILSWSYHATSVTLLEELALRSRNIHWPLGNIPDEAEKVLGRLKILQSPGWKEDVKRRVRVPAKDDYGFEDWSGFAWAYEVAWRKSVAALPDCLAERARPLSGGDFEESDIKDIALVHFAELGGELTEAEFNRLRPNGFVGDAEERLLEIVSEERIR